MQFAEVVGQAETKEHLRSTVLNGRIPHAQLFFGPEGNGKYALALAYAQYLNCTNRTSDDSCGVCPSCIKVSKLAHPDVHFFFPTTTTKKIKKDPESKLFAEDWRKYLTKCENYPDLIEWYEFVGVENKQGTLYVRDAIEINRLLGFKPYESHYTIFIIWMPEKLHLAAANKLLKNLEEPPMNTLFLLVSENPEQVLNTIRSRSSMLKIPRIAQNDLSAYLAEYENLSPEKAFQYAVLSYGNLKSALNLVRQPGDYLQQMEQFRLWMRLCFDHKYLELIDFANSTASLGRERIKILLEYGLRSFRHVMLHQYGQFDLVKTMPEEKEFLKRFAEAIGQVEMPTVINLLEESIGHVERNVNTSLLISSLSFKIAKLIGRKMH